MIVFRQGPRNQPFAWEAASQPAARWHGADEGPATYVATTADAAWAEFLRHEDIRDQADLDGVARWLWAIELPDPVDVGVVVLDGEALFGDESTYPACQAEARRLRQLGHTTVRAPSAAVLPSPSGFRTDRGLVPGPPLGEQTLVLYGRRPEIVGWIAAGPGHPDASLLARIRHL